MKNTAKKIAAGTVGAASLFLASAATANADSVHHVAKNDTVWSLSQKYGVSIKSIEQLNHIDQNTNMIYVGQDLQIPGKTAQAPKQNHASTYVVKEGDSLWVIAQKFHTSVEHLRQLNSLTSSTIYVGQTLKIDGQAASTKTATTTQAQQPTVKVATKTVATPKTSVASSQASVKSTPAVASTVTSQAAPASSASQATVKSTPAVASTTSSVSSSASSASSNVASQASSSSVASQQTVQSSSQSSSVATAQASVASSASSASSSVASQASSSSVASQQTVQSSTQQQSSSVQNYTANNYAASNSSSRAAQPAATTNNQVTSSNTANTNNNTQTQNTAATTSSKASSASSTTRTGSGSNVVSFAESLIGVPYVYGGTTPSGFDCSGFVQYVYSHFGVNLPRTTTQQENCGTQIPVSQAQPGDLYFWGSKGSSYHVAIAIGGGKYVAAPEPGQSVSIGSTQYFQPSFAVRL